MSITKIYESYEYQKFDLLEFNRDVNKIKSLKASLEKHGWISAYPMNVKENGYGRYKIKDGHHRFEIAKMLGIPVKFVVCNDDSTVYELDKATNKWSLADVLISYCRSGNIEYQKIQQYCSKTGIGIMNAIEMLGGSTAGSANSIPKFKSGRFICNPNPYNAQIIGDIVIYCKQRGIDWAHHSILVTALSRIAWVKEFSPAHLKSKIKSFPYLFTKQPHLEGYLDMLENIYNFKSQEKIPLRFMADQAMKDRRIANKQKEN